MSVALVSAQLNELFASSGLEGPMRRSNGDVRALQHFHTVTASTIGPPYMTSLIQAILLPKAWYDPALMHLALAVSAAHQGRLLRDTQDEHAVRRLRFTEIQHWQTALALHQKQMAAKELPQDVGAHVLKLSLTVIFTFSLDDDLPVDTFLDGEDAKIVHAMAPVAACNGFRALRVMTNSWDALDMTSPWANVLTSADDDASTFTDEQAGVEGLPSAFIDLCNLDCGSTSDHNVYHRVLRLLTPLLQLEPGLNNFVRLLAFGGRIWLDVKLLATQRDHVILLLIAYWLVLLRQVNQWWVLTRARSACDAIVNYLLQNSQDPKLHYLLLYPASFGERGIDRIWTQLVPARAASQM
ncbi:hypothetical protein LTR86_006399 [Recurvomyces mirabilis]|nr:hypothetical protein LTR86_006399 [Recurvomyces mirabilis]